jgi:hypothetical protein
MPRRNHATCGHQLNSQVNVAGRAYWGAITEAGDRFFPRFEECVTAKYAKYFILGLYNEFQEDSIVVLNGTLYFQASAVTGRQICDDLTFVRFPSYSPELNPVKECWRQL